MTGLKGLKGLQVNQGLQVSQVQMLGMLNTGIPFLTNWGKASGRMSCSDPLLTSTAFFRVQEDQMSLIQSWKRQSGKSECSMWY